MEKIKRANLVTSLWKNAARSDPAICTPEENGWVTDHDANVFRIKWFDGPLVPENVGAHIGDECEILQDNEACDDALMCSSSDESESEYD